MLDWLIGIVVAAFAVYRVAELLYFDQGIFDVCFRFRAWSGVYDRDEQGEPKTTLGKLFDCPHCIGLWGALIAAILIHAVLFCLGLSAWFVLLFPLTWFAIAGGQSFLETTGGRK